MYHAPDLRMVNDVVTHAPEAHAEDNLTNSRQYRKWT